MLEELSVLHNFTVESQVQYHAPLAFTPHPVAVGDETAFELDQDQLKTFVNSAEWSLGKRYCFRTGHQDLTRMW